MNPKYRYITDSGHGWLQVKLDEIKNIKDKISSYSYMDSRHVYLEEDCDMPLFMQAKNIVFDDIVEVNYNGQCYVRELWQYHA